MGLVGRPACFGGACPANHTRVIIYFGPGIVGGDTLSRPDRRVAIRNARRNPRRSTGAGHTTADFIFHRTSHLPGPCFGGLRWHLPAVFWGPPFRAGCFGMQVAYLGLRRGFESPPPPHYRSGASDHPRSHGLKPLTRATKTGCSCRVRGPTFFVPFSLPFSLLGAFHPLTLDYCRFGALLCGIPEDWKSMLLERVSRPVGPA